MKTVEDLYALTPMQKMMLLHSLTTQGSDVLFSQFSYAVLGQLDHEAFGRAWVQILEHHPILRSCFLWQDLQEPVQVVRRGVELPFQKLDWRHLPLEERDARLTELRQSQREEGFDLGKAPLLRITLVQLEDAFHELIWESHHLILDRWCIHLVLEELARRYAAICRGASTPPDHAPRFADYLRWLQRQDRGRAEEFWRASLAGFRTASPLTEDRGTTTQDESRCQLELTLPETAALRTFARDQQVTPGVVVQGAWALLLGRVTGQRDVVFGATVAGRPPDLPGVESILGSLISNLPVRARLPADRSVGAWLKELHRHQQVRAPFEYVSTADVHRWSELPAHQALFDNLVVWLNPVQSDPPPGLDLRPLPGELQTAWPVTLGVEEQGDRMRLQLACRAALRGGRTGIDLLQELRELLGQLTQGPAATLGALLGESGDPVAIDAEHGTQEGGNGAAAGRRRPVPVDREATVAHGGRRSEGAEVLEESLRREWCALLGRDRVAPEDHFFQCGGTSLQAVQLHQRVEQLTGRAVPLLDLFQEPTPAGMTRTLLAQDWPFQASFVRPLREEGTRPPLFCIASPEVNTIGYALVARHLDPDVPVYVVQAPPGSDEVRRVAPSEMPELAAAYLKEIRQVEAEGPYRFLGMCGGSHLSLEMARQLEQEGQSADFVGIVNTWGLYTLTWRFYLLKALNRLRWYRQRLGALVRRPAGEWWTTVRSVLRRRTRSVLGVLQTRPPTGPPVRSAEEIEREWYAADWPRKELPPKFGGTVTVFRLAEQDWFRVRDEELGWRNHAEEVELVHLPTVEHLDILREPHVGLIAKEIDTCLQARDRATGREEG